MIKQLKIKKEVALELEWRNGATNQDRVPVLILKLTPEATMSLDSMLRSRDKAKAEELVVEMAMDQPLARALGGSLMVDHVMVKQNRRG